MTLRKISTIISAVHFNRNINCKGGQTVTKKIVRQKKVAKKPPTRKRAKKMKRDEPFENFAKLRRRKEKKHGREKGRRLVERLIIETVEKAVGEEAWSIEGTK